MTAYSADYLSLNPREGDWDYFHLGPNGRFCVIGLETQEM